MTTLAPKLPYSHPFAGGYPRLGGQALPTDPDAIDYLERVAAADGAAVEVGVAMAVDAFVKGCKADGIWSAIKASCIMAGARTISGALVPLVGPAPTPYNLVNFDYERSTGIQGDGSSTYLDSGLDNDDTDTLPEDSMHISAYPTSIGTGGYYVLAPATFIYPGPLYRIRQAANTSVSALTAETFIAAQRTGVNATEYLANGATSSGSQTFSGASAGDVTVFGPSVFSDARLAFYSIGTSVDLAALDARVTNLVKGIQFWNYTGLSPHAYDPDTIAYVVAGYAAGGTL